MKKLLGILVLGLLWCNVGFAEKISIICKETKGPLFYKEWNETYQVSVDINNDVKPGFLKIDTLSSWFDLDYVPIIFIDDTKIIAEGDFMFNYVSRTIRFIEKPIDLLLDDHTNIDPEKIKEGDGTLRKYTIEIDRLRGTLNFKMHKAHWIDMPAEVSLNEYQGWNEARKCQKNKKLF